VGFLHRQQCGYVWLTGISASNAPRSRSSAMIRGFASHTVWPAKYSISAMKRPSSSTGL